LAYIKIDLSPTEAEFASEASDVGEMMMQRVAEDPCGALLVVMLVYPLCEDAEMMRLYLYALQLT
jgi:hypothetical protein